MPKMLSTNESHASPIARLLDTSAARGAMRPASAEAPRPEMASAPVAAAESPRPSGPSVLIKRECVLTRTTDEAMTRLTDLIRRSTGARVNASHAVRCLLNALAPVWPRVEEELRALGPLRLPSNARGCEAEREAMEQRLAGAVGRAMRSGHPER